MRQTMYDQDTRWEQAEDNFGRLKTFLVEAVEGQELHEVEAELSRCPLALGRVLSP